MNRYDPNPIVTYYDDLGIGEWERLVSSPTNEVKLHIHQHYLQKYLKAGEHILELGAGAGRFTQFLASLDTKIAVGDISPEQLRLNRKFAKENGFESNIDDWHELNILDLSKFDDDSYDHIVCYGGPLSYMFEKDREALIEMKRVVKKNGLVFISVMSLYGSCHQFLPFLLDVPSEKNWAILDSGDVHPDTHQDSNHRCHMYHSQEFADLLTNNGFEILDLSASNSMTAAWDEETLAKFRKSDKEWTDLLKLELRASAQPGCLDIGTHLIAVAKKI